MSVRFIVATKISLSSAIIDVGSGSSHLIDDLVGLGFTNITALDISSTSLKLAKTRLGEKAHQVNWIEADITKVEFPKNAFDVWHDRAVFHFLILPEQRHAYINKIQNSVKIGGHIIIATFAEDGPTTCSGLPVRRYSPQELHAEFGDSFELIHSEKEIHSTPFGSEQKFNYCYFRKVK